MSRGLHVARDWGMWLFGKRPWGRNMLGTFKATEPRDNDKKWGWKSSHRLYPISCGKDFFDLSVMGNFDLSVKGKLLEGFEQEMMYSDHFVVNYLKYNTHIEKCVEYNQLKVIIK